MKGLGRFINTKAESSLISQASQCRSDECRHFTRSADIKSVKKGEKESEKNPGNKRLKESQE